MICLLHIRGLRRRILNSVHFRLLTSRYRNFQVATGRNQDSASCYGQHKARGLIKHPHLHLMGASKQRDVPCLFFNAAARAIRAKGVHGSSPQGERTSIARAGSINGETVAVCRDVAAQQRAEAHARQPPLLQQLQHLCSRAQHIMRRPLRGLRRLQPVWQTHV